jgi:hypothetical protein
MAEEEEKVFVNVQVPEGMDMILRELAAKKRTSRSDIVRIAISEYIDKYRVVGVSELPGPSDGSKYTPVPVILVESVHDGE